MLGGVRQRHELDGSKPSAGRTISLHKTGSGSGTLQSSPERAPSTSDTPSIRSFSRQTTGESILDAIQDPDSQVFDTAEARIRRCGFRGYFVICLVVTSGIALASMFLWSDMGCGPECLEFLKARFRFWPIFAGIMFVVLLTLYLLDFFCPPHMPGHYCTLSEQGSPLGRTCFVVAFLSFLALCYFLAEQFPTLPVVVTIFLGPLGVMLLRQATMPKERFVRGQQRVAKEGVPPSAQQLSHVGRVERQGFELRMGMLKMLTGEERDQKNFYIAATCSFILAGFLCLIIWIPWAARKGDFERQMKIARSKEERELVFVRWACPLIVSVSNFVFASFTGLRVALNRAYTATDEVRNRLIIGGRKSCMNRELMNHRINMLRTRLEAGDQSPETIVRETQDKMQQYLVQHISHMRQLSNIVKSVGCAFVVFLGALYVAFQLTAADSHLAFMVQGFLGAFLLTFMLVTFVSFGRLWQVMRDWLMDLPLWKSAASLCRREWAIAAVVCLAFPFVPIALVLSVATQRVRRCRGICKDKEAEQRCLTDRTNDFIGSMQELNWINMFFWFYVWSTVMVIYKLTPIFLNVLLAWMSHLMANLNFVWICAATYAAGMVLFMLPPVPGPPIYLFGGVVISEKCPWGFWWGSIICIVLCFILKLSACAIQQKVFGELLGNMKSVRQMVGVHKPFIRAIEMVLRRPGLSFGKCMILCGGPDWPVSVLAGILRLSLWQCLVGTFPIIANVVPLVLTGSFYLKRDESQVWVRAGNLMFSLVALVSVVFWVGMGWAIQDVFEREHENLLRPREEYIDLEWLDHRSGLISAKCVVVWSDVPLLVKVPYILGATCLANVGVLFFWRSAVCFGSFKVTESITELVWFGRKGLIKMPGAAGLSVAGASYLGLVVYKCWAARRSNKLRAVAVREVDLLEAEWKARRLEEARNCANAEPSPRGFGVTNLPSSLLSNLQDTVTTAVDVNSATDVEAGQNPAGPEESHRASSAGVQQTLLLPAPPDTAARVGVLAPIAEVSPVSTEAAPRGISIGDRMITDLLPIDSGNGSPASADHVLEEMKPRTVNHSYSLEANSAALAI